MGNNLKHLRVAGWEDSGQTRFCETFTASLFGITIPGTASSVRS